ncbi:MAG: succinate dehydrogenase [Planctomycetes bacterium]|nr:succinate dehydrogenase [Planctomycetota bacterium]
MGTARQSLTHATPSAFGATARRDAWWLQSLVVFLAFSTFLVYSTWAAFQGEHYTFGPYLSPFYSPELWGNSPHAWFGPPPNWWPSGLVRYSPAHLILWAPGAFRFTCYYYRGAYYKAFWGDPPGCTVGEPRKKYLGEHTFPLILQNAHRFFMFLAMFMLAMLVYDAWKGLWFTDAASGVKAFGIGVGSLVLITNVVLLSSYLLGCHSLRHLVGGSKDTLSDSVARFQAWKCVSCLNRRHMLFAWLSLCSVGFSDLYVRLCSMGIWTDWRIL